ncbi:hypothetical protein BTS2_2082 [Bacillus sp. TS-2]|nr:hypothetical protein BTS2_2082 [Bacillus sp. TS-2]
MNNQLLVRIENGMAFLFSFYIYVQLDFPIWLFFVLLLAPDVTMIGYAWNHKIGASIYNLGHSLILPLIFLLFAIFFKVDTLLLLSIIWLAHIFIDRFFGYGLKYPDNFKHTHIQEI